MTADPTEKALFSIDYDGRWFHDGAEIRRHELARLFARKGLKRDPDGRYWLRSPEAQYPVLVADVPFLIVDFDIHNPGKDQAVDLRTNMDDTVALGPDHSFILRPEPKAGTVIPYIEVRAGLLARLSRPVYYKLVGHGIAGHGMITLRSRGVDHSLGSIESGTA